jgi:nicotinate-nucleotide adenylyltransferase
MVIVTLLTRTTMRPAPDNECPRPKLALFGGAFDPPTLGHAAVAEQLLRAGFDRIVVMPCFGHTFGKTLAPASERLLLAAEAFRHLRQVRVSSFEIDLGLNGSTYELVSKLPLLPEFRSHRAFMAIGSDEANVFHRWRRHAELRMMIPFVVVMRPGYPLSDDGLWATHPPHVIVPYSEGLMEASSTAAKAAIAVSDFERANRLLNPRVLAHVLERGLYSTSTAA